MARVFINTTGERLSAGSVTFPAGAAVNVSNQFRLDKAPVSTWIADGDLVEDGAPAPADRGGTIAEIISRLGDDEFTKGGKPEVDAINDALPDDMDPVTAAERDAIWAKMEG